MLSCGLLCAEFGCASGSPHLKSHLDQKPRLSKSSGNVQCLSAPPWLQAAPVSVESAALSIFVPLAALLSHTQLPERETFGSHLPEAPRYQLHAHIAWLGINSKSRSGYYPCTQLLGLSLSVYNRFTTPSTPSTSLRPRLSSPAKHPHAQTCPNPTTTRLCWSYLAWSIVSQIGIRSAAFSDTEQSTPTICRDAEMLL